MNSSIHWEPYLMQTFCNFSKDGIIPEDAEHQNTEANKIYSQS